VLTYKQIRALLTVAVCTLAVTFAVTHAGAADDTFKRSAELGKRTAKTSEDVNRYITQLDKTEHTLFSVGQAEGKDLKKRYESFSEDIKKLEDAQKHATSDINEMKTTGAEYVSAWETSIAQISDPQLRQASTEHRTKVMKDHDDLAVSLSEVGSQLEPFMTSLRDIKAFLGTDLSPTNVAKATDMIQKSQADAQVLKAKLAAVEATLQQFLAEAPR
jgi:F0F1-type ATP synthase membrane subunit b/b'